MSNINMAFNCMLSVAEPHNKVKFSHNHVTNILSIYLQTRDQKSFICVGTINESDGVFKFNNINFRNRNLFTNIFETFYFYIMTLVDNVSLRSEAQRFLTIIHKLYVIDLLQFCISKYVDHYNIMLESKMIDYISYRNLSKSLRSCTPQEIMIYSNIFHQSFNNVVKDFDESDPHNHIKTMLCRINEYVINSIDIQRSVVVNRQKNFRKTIEKLSDEDLEQFINVNITCELCNEFFAYQMLPCCNHKLCLSCILQNKFKCKHCHSSYVRTINPDVHSIFTDDNTDTDNKTNINVHVADDNTNKRKSKNKTDKKKKAKNKTNNKKKTKVANVSENKDDADADTNTTINSNTNVRVDVNLQASDADTNSDAAIQCNQTVFAAFERGMTTRAPSPERDSDNDASHTTIPPASSPLRVVEEEQQAILVSSDDDADDFQSMATRVVNNIIIKKEKSYDDEEDEEAYEDFEEMVPVSPKKEIDDPSYERPAIVATPETSSKRKADDDDDDIVWIDPQENAFKPKLGYMFRMSRRVVKKRRSNTTPNASC
ncbi:hoar [Orgyia leucostigma nucleopolyhedrovirus]|uniref:Hoar n=1 Tax=Orgyia leucostigma nucleopolyhedrovirus TaxID=490711 RepID=B0FDM2_9ABAC|nr:hoar [Orgyia leucostigma nucleopolyhedrovirus]ABY65730.1 hoar [Orgyia leucostigma nucleopolyhedrovirus]